MVFISGLVATLLLVDLNVSTDLPSGVSEVGLINLVFFGAIGTPPMGSSLFLSDRDDPPWLLESDDSDDEPGLDFAPRGMISPGGGKAAMKINVIQKGSNILVQS